MSNIVNLDNIRSINFASILGTYVVVGTPFDHNARIIHFVNNTDGDLLISDDGVNDKIMLPAHSYVVYDFNTNRGEYDAVYTLPQHFQLYVKYNTAPTTKDLWVSNLYNRGD